MYAGLLALVTGAAACAVGVQYGTKILVDALGGVTRDEATVFAALALFLTLVGVETVLWRLSGWLGSRTIIAAGVDVRIDLFDHLSGHAARFFAEQSTGALGSRITAAAGATGAITSTLAWGIAPPITDFLGALVVLSLVDWRLALALVGFVAVVGGGLSLFASRATPLHRAYAEQAASVGGELIDAVSNVWVVKAFSARGREHAGLAGKFAVEAAAQQKSWLFLEKTRVLHDVCLWLMAGSMLIWVVHLWNTGQATPGDVVVVSALTFRILHGSRDLALALAGLTQHVEFIADTLRVIAQPHEVPDARDARPLLSGGGSIKFENISFPTRTAGASSSICHWRSRPGRRSASSARPVPVNRRSSTSCSASPTSTRVAF